VGVALAQITEQTHSADPLLTAEDVAESESQQGHTGTWWLGTSPVRQSMYRSGNAHLFIWCPDGDLNHDR
jgi:hypothetical protein